VTNRDLLLEGWAWRPAVALPVAALLALHAARWRLRAPSRWLALLGAAAVVVVALTSPIETLARGVLFSAHMLQHMLLLLVAPPLALIALPRRSTGAHGRGAGPAVTWLLGVGAMWMWHAPVLCNAATSSERVRAAQTLSLLAMGLAFWWPLLGPRLDRRLSDLGAVAYLFTACVACTLLGVSITFSPVEVCSAYLHPHDPLGLVPLVRDGWGLTPSVDQQLGGLLMWVPGCAVYASAILAIVARFHRGPRAALRSAP
jgi:cytochrome c oxidase assembly factor CtaG